jgi:spermidine/putrescine transport system permease protein
MTATALTPAAATEGPIRPGPPLWLGRAGRVTLNAVAVGGFIYLFLPIFEIVRFSFNEPKSKNNIVWNRFTLENWGDPFQSDELNSALWKSLQIGFWAMLASTVMGSLVAIAMSRYRFRGGAIVNLLLVLPLTTPEIVLGASLLNMFVKYRDAPGGYFEQRGFATVLISHTMFCVSFVALTVKARVRGFDWTLEDAAMDLGARPLRVFFRVTFPLILPGILAAGLLAFSLSLDDFIITSFTSGQFLTFPLYLQGAIQKGIPPQIQVLASLILVVSLAIIGLGTLWRVYREGRLAARTT